MAVCSLRHKYGPLSSHDAALAHCLTAETGPPCSEALERQRSAAKRCGTIQVCFFNMEESPEVDNTNQVKPRPNQQWHGDTELSEKVVKGKAVDSFTA